MAEQHSTHRAKAAGAAAFREFLQECERQGVDEISPETLPRERFQAMAAEHRIRPRTPAFEAFSRGFWEAMTGRIAPEDDDA